MSPIMTFVKNKNIRIIKSSANGESLMYVFLINREGKLKVKIKKIAGLMPAIFSCYNIKNIISSHPSAAWPLSAAWFFPFLHCCHLRRLHYLFHTQQNF